MSLEVVPLQGTGTKVSEIALGTWRFGRANAAGEVEIKRGRAFELLDAYAEWGGNFIDTADSYGDGMAEQLIGDWLQPRDREEFVLASKIFWPTRPDDPNGRGLGRKHLRRQIELMLERLGTDYLDLLYIHRWDDETPVDEFIRTLSGFVDDGRVNYLGVSSNEPNAWRVAMAIERAGRAGYEPFKLAQMPYNLVEREIEGEFQEMCREYDVGLITWSPLAGGFLTGKYERGEEPPDGSRGATDPSFAEKYLRDECFDVLDVVREVADEVDATPAQVALAWQLHHGDVTAPIIGARTVDQLEEDLATSEISLTQAQVERLTGAA